MKAPAFQTYASDFYMDTNSWTIEEIGIYQRLLLTEWTNGFLPNDEERLARIAGCKLKIFKNFWPIISQKFSQNGNGNLVNKRMEEVRQNQLKYSESRRKNVSVRYQDKPTYEGTHVAHMNRSSSSSSSSTSKKNKTYTSFFLSFWEAYPKKVGKPNTFKEWNKLKPELEVVLGALQAQIEEKERLTAENKFCPDWPDPERWIKNQRWLDEITDGPIEDRRMYEIEQARKKNGHTEPT